MSVHARASVIALEISCARLAHAGDAGPAAVAPPASDVASPAAGMRSHAAPQSADTPRPPPQGASAHSRSTALQLETTQITGNRELPKVMVIVPWKNAEPAELAGRPINSLVEEVLTPIDRDVMRRTLDYYRLLAPDAESAEETKQAAEIESTDQ